ncbi:type II toxin-antitoxin system PemK/MazF family toxin [Candidatus Nitrosotenuis uzonensis]|uniref:Putative Transcriptional modulator of MazE/toxin, MazF n=1 Tax=Candidatus Nitrosotenuis uzonensis TaxID=1407055 RepID=A0A812F4M4_9ARCH|nr:type II toxin-antitoxin system PemK/MazF family toxin [Candidatus Nitrosotenuis uzonensis]CAE6488009.1 putative Transcriptional modulator of MazE/toxin, MazF [Candidatus Nitrosotenuis uzonensis]
MKRTESGISFEQGQILLIALPFNDLSKMRQRPVLVLTNKIHNDISSDFVCCGITSNLDNKKYSILLERGCSGRKDPKTSRIKFSKIFALEKSLVVKELAG